MSPHPDTAAAPTEVPVRRGRLPLTLEYPPATPRPPRDTTPSLVTPDPRSVGPRPVALALLWFALMAPLAFAARYAQATWGLGGDAVPLVMAAPALAAIACLAAVPGGQPLVLNDSAAVIWREALRTPETEVVDAVASATGQDPDTVRADVLDFVSSLVTRGFLIRES